MPYLNRGNAELYYEEFGEGFPIIFTSSIRASHNMWDEPVTEFAPDYHTITYDWRGTGRSSRPRSGYTAEIAAADLIALIEEVAKEPALLVGHGNGTHITLIAARMRPDLVRGLVVLDGAPWVTGEHDGVIGGMAPECLKATTPRRGMSAADGLERMVRDWLFLSPPSDAVVHALIQDGLTWPQYVLGEYRRDMMTIDHRPYLNSIVCPVLVVHGRHDSKQNYDGGVYLANKLPNANLLTLEHSKHMGYVEEPDVFNHAVRELLRRVVPAAEPIHV